MLYLLRHGRTELNDRGCLQGRLDPPLDDIGQRQARSIAGEVRRLTEATGGVRRVISSPLRRAVATAEYVGGGVEIDAAWTELDYGEYEGVAVTEVPGEVWQGWFDDPDYATQGGESFGALTERVQRALEDLGSQAAEHNIVVVSHVGPIKAAVTWALGGGYQAMFRCRLATASICVVGVGAFGPTLHRFNHTVPIDDAAPELSDGLDA